MFGKAKKDLSNGLGTIPKGELCELINIWINNTVNDIYVRIRFEDMYMITSLSNIEVNKNINI